MSRRLLLRRLLGGEPGPVAAQPPVALVGPFTRQASKPAIRRLPPPGPWPRRQYYCTAKPLMIFRWYHDPWKVAAAASAVSGAALVAFCRRCLEVVPCTNRPHFVLSSPRSDRERGESEFASYKEEEAASQILGPFHPDTLRVRLIAGKIIHAAYRGLGIYDSRDAPILRVTGSRQQSGKAWSWRPQPRTSHLHGLNWEVIVVEDDLQAGAFCIDGGKVIVFTGFLQDYSTDGEIAYAIAHEVGHIIARHESDITSCKWWPMPLWVYFRRRMETEADHIGMLLLAAAGFNPDIALAFCKKKAKMAGVQTFKQYHLSGYPPYQKRFQFLSQPKIMEMALELYREVTSMNIVTERYFR